ncbi:MAG: hypothetical protein PHF86_12275, partial [Candidatus Nanoarchaeia archaeon]|nr:hypothetical protein [Candidatus Nanoarchaeia archaeon]
MNSKYETNIKPNFELIKSWREKGLTERQIAEKLKIHYSTLQKYKTQNEDLKRVLQTSKEKLVANLKKSLWEEALGYEYEETDKLVEKKPFRLAKRDKTGKILKDENGDTIFTTEYKEVVKIRKVTRKARPVPTLLIFALCNLCPEEFKRQDKDVESQIDELTNDIREL